MNGAMSPLQALLLGILQGLTEFLPVSSSGHLALADALLGFPPAGVAFAVLVHAGTLLAVFLVFAPGVRGLIGAGWAWVRSPLRPPPAAMPAVHVAIATVPGALVGLFLEEAVERAFASPQAVGWCLLITAAWLLSTRAVRQGHGEVTWKVALLVGCAQAVAVLPGVSRSGATICTALLLGVARPKAAEFSFLAAIPLILGSVVLELPDLAEGSRNGSGLALAVGFVAAFLVGWVALRWLVGLVRGGRLHWFAPYCAAAGVAAILALR